MVRLVCRVVDRLVLTKEGSDKLYRVEYIGRQVLRIPDGDWLIQKRFLACIHLQDADDWRNEFSILIWYMRFDYKLLTRCVHREIRCGVEDLD